MEFENALNHEILKEFANNCSLKEVGELRYQLICYEINIKPRSLPEFLDSLNYERGIAKFLNFKILKNRLKYLDLFAKEEKVKSNKSDSINLYHFIPELHNLEEFLIELIEKSANSIEKAQGHLYTVALGAGANSHMEAAIYFASRSEFLLEVCEIRERWRKRLCYIIEREGNSKVSETIRNAARSNTLTLSQASELLLYNESGIFLPKGLTRSFFDCWDAEFEFIDATFIRSIEWFNVTGFESWLNFCIKYFPDVLYECDIFDSAWYLFYWCRSELALQKTNTAFLESFLLKITNRDKPWRCLNTNEIIDNVPIAGIIIFSWLRIKPLNLDSSILQSASEFLFQTHLISGGWPIYSNETKPSILSTCVAIHALSIYKPNGYKPIIDKAVDWLFKEQNVKGFWYEKGNSPVMLTVLVLDSIHLAMGDEKTTLSINLRETNLNDTIKLPIPPQPKKTNNPEAIEKMITFNGPETIDNLFKELRGFFTQKESELKKALNGEKLQERLTVSIDQIKLVEVFRRSKYNGLLPNKLTEIRDWLCINFNQKTGLPFNPETVYAALKGNPDLINSKKRILNNLDCYPTKKREIKR